MAGQSTYNDGKLAEAKHYVRFLIADTNERRFRVTDNEINALLAMHGLTATSAVAANAEGVYATALACAERIVAELAMESRVTITDVGQTKSTAASAYRINTVNRLRKRVGEIGGEPSFLNPATYDLTYVEGIDTEPDPE